jgi:hypothetical protein
LRLWGLPWTRISRRSLAPSVPINWSVFLKKSAAKFAGLKKSATHLPNYWLAEIPQTLALMRLGRQSAERERISENQLQLEIKKLCPPKWRVKLRLFSWF